ncbi:MAG: hypothetical protein WAM26_15255, partial [Nitrososphaeraceae archaeon]
KHRVIRYVQDLPFIVEAIDYLGSVVSINITGTSTGEIDQVASGLANRFELDMMLCQASKSSPNRCQ